MAPTATCPRSSLSSPEISSSIDASSAITLLAMGSRVAPASVSVTGPGPRWKSGVPSMFSSRRIWALTEGWATSNRSAARVNWPSSATARKYRSWWTAGNIVKAYDNKTKHVFDFCYQTLYPVRVVRPRSRPAGTLPAATREDGDTA